MSIRATDELQLEVVDAGSYRRFTAMRWPIRNQILLPLLAVAIVSLTAVGAINTVFTERRTQEHVERQLRQVIGVLTTSSFPLTNSVLRQMRELSSADYVLTDRAGNVVASTLVGVGPLPEEPVTANIQAVQLGPSVERRGAMVFSHAGETIGRSGERPQRYFARAISAGRVSPGVAAGVCAVVRGGRGDRAGGGGRGVGAGEPDGAGHWPAAHGGTANRPRRFSWCAAAIDRR